MFAALLLLALLVASSAAQVTIENNVVYYIDAQVAAGAGSGSADDPFSLSAFQQTLGGMTIAAYRNYRNVTFSFNGTFFVEYAAFCPIVFVFCFFPGCLGPTSPQVLSVPMPHTCLRSRGV
jgi:hypothetical protein